MTINLLHDKLQKMENDTCGLFQLYFCQNLFLPFSKIKENQLNKKTNEIFVLDEKENEQRIEKI